MLLRTWTTGLRSLAAHAIENYLAYYLNEKVTGKNAMSRSRLLYELTDVLYQLKS